MANNKDSFKNEIGDIVNEIMRKDNESISDTIAKYEAMLCALDAIQETFNRALVDITDAVERNSEYIGKVKMILAILTSNTNEEVNSDFDNHWDYLKSFDFTGTEKEN